MTNAEAIETLRANYPDCCFEQLRAAVDKAIKVLEAQDATGDSISRQAAIRIASGYCHPANIADELRKLPSAQPERKKGKWIPVTKIYKVTEGQFPNTHIEWVDATEPDEIDAVRCSECREVFDFQEARNWCTECGADMRKEGAANADAES